MDAYPVIRDPLYHLMELTHLDETCLGRAILVSYCCFSTNSQRYCLSSPGLSLPLVLFDANHKAYASNGRIETLSCYSVEGRLGLWVEWVRRI